MRRIGYDIKDTMEKYPHIEIHTIFKPTQIILTFQRLSPNEIPISKRKPTNTDFKDVKIVLKTDVYPFTVPQITIRGQPYNHFLIAPSPKIINMIQPFSSCLCCKSILKTENWLPTYQLSDVLKEIVELNDLKRTIKYILSLDPISKKFKIPTILEYNILEYLSNTTPILQYVKKRT